MSRIKKEATPCAANNLNQSPIPTDAPSQDPSPATARGASTGTTAPGGQMKPPDGSKLYFNEDASLVYRFSGTGRFQFWLFSGHQEWKSSDFLNHTYALENRENLKPPAQWLAEYAAAHEWREITKKEFDEMCCTNAPTAAAAATTESPAAEPGETLTTSEIEADVKISKDWRSGATDASSLSDRHSPVDAVPATQSPSDAGAACLEADPGRPAFDFSTLGELAEQASEADAQFNLHYGRALDEYIISCIYLARIHELTARAGRYGGGTWTAWYKSKGISEGTKTRMLETGNGFKYSTLEDLKLLPELTRKDLFLIARSGCAQQVIDASGNNQQIQDLLAQLKVKDDEVAATKSQLGAALADVDGLSQQNARLQRERDNAEKRAAETEKQLEGSRQVAAAERSRAEHWKEKAEAMAQQSSAPPIEAKVVDADEVERLAAEKASRMIEERTADQREQAAREAYDAFILAGRSLDSLWRSLAPNLPRLDPRQRSAAVEPFVQKLMYIKEEIQKCL